MNKFPEPLEKGFCCSPFGPCKGVEWAKDRETPAVYQEAQKFFEQKGISSLNLHRGPSEGWRFKAKLAVRGSPKDIKIGLFKENSHVVVEIPFCKAHHPQINQAVLYFKQFMLENGLTPYDEVTYQGDVRYIQLALERSTQKVQITVILNHKNHQKLEKLWDSPPQFWHSIWANINTRRDNVIFGDEWVHMKGEKFIWEKFGEREVAFLPASFTQSNLSLFEEMLQSIQKKIPPQTQLVEFYAGVGVIGLYLVKTLRQVICAEINSQAKECFNVSAAKLPPSEAKKISFQVGSASDLLLLLEGAETILVDPPRKGLDKTFLQKLKSLKGPRTLIYISCGWPSFQRDCTALIESNWKIKSGEAYLFFPGTNHIELLAFFQKE